MKKLTRFLQPGFPGFVALAMAPFAMMGALAWAQSTTPQPNSNQGVGGQTPAPLINQKSFPTAEDACQSFAAAAESGDTAKMAEILGPEAAEVMSSGDPIEDGRDRIRFVAKYREMHRLAKEPDGSMLLYVGAENWPLPIPLVNRGSGWYFDTAAGKQEILYRRIGENEFAAMQACHALADAETLYLMRAHHVDGAKRYAQRFLSSQEDGGHDGLYWLGAPDESESPLDAALAAAGSDPAAAGGTRAPVPYHGYYFRILTKQGKNAHGGAKSYVADGKMTRGFAFIAYPAEYSSSGIMTFMFGPDGVVYEKDLGPETPKLAPAITEYDPDPSWNKTSGD